MTEPMPTTGTPATRSIELEVEVPGTPEEVWQAVATGPGISSWFIPMDVEEREGGTVTMHWGPAFGDTTAEVAAWEPPHRVVLRDREGDHGLAYEWLVEARDGGSCVVRLVNSGFGTGDEWDEQYHGMSEGWKLFLAHLRVQRSHFAGRWASSTTVPTAFAAGPRPEAWARVCGMLGMPAEAQPGDRVATGDDAPPLAGRVAEVVRTDSVTAYVLVLDDPHPGTAFVAAEGNGESVAISAYLYLYDTDDRPADPAVGEAWRAWLARHFDTQPAGLAGCDTEPAGTSAAG